MPKPANFSIIRTLFVVFVLSTILLVASILVSIQSILKLSASSQLVSHTNEVLAESENFGSLLKDAEAAQRAYLITRNLKFREKTQGVRDQLIHSYSILKVLTRDHPVQQERLERLINEGLNRATYLEKLMKLMEAGILSLQSAAMHEQILKGVSLMERVGKLLYEIKTEENRLLKDRTEELNKYSRYTPLTVTIAALISILITVFSFLRIRHEMSDRLQKQIEEQERYQQTEERINGIEAVTKEISSGNYEVRSMDQQPDELGRISTALNSMLTQLQRNMNDLSLKNWMETESLNISNALRGHLNTEALGEALLKVLVEITAMNIAVFYTKGSREFRRAAVYACGDAPGVILPGHGLSGQALKDGQMQVFNGLPADYLRITSVTGSALPVTVVAMPLSYNQEVLALMEIGFLHPPKKQVLELLKNIQESLGIAVYNCMTFKKMSKLLEETQAQSEEMQAQHSELETLNSELEAQTQKLQASEEELRVQQEELQQTNGELEERSNLLLEKNLEIQRKAEELSQSTRYKTEFLANMSHELRTPLNSILLLSRLLSENSSMNLNEEEIEYARVIQNSGQGLLALIDEILDLSKIEAGKMTVDFREVNLQVLADDLRALFNAQAKEKNLEFGVSLAEGVPVSIETDATRLSQILKNFLSNALKFTGEGAVRLTVQEDKERKGWLIFSVKDTGIGIAKEKQEQVFDAFQQADGSTRRKYGGTGLGLSISRQLSVLLGGEISLASKEDEGSEFLLRLPVRHRDNENISSEFKGDDSHSAQAIDNNKFLTHKIPVPVADDRDDLGATDRTILIIEDDHLFAKVLMEYTKRQGYKVLVSVRGDEGLDLAKKYRPVGILLDIQLPVKSGWEVLEELKKDKLTRRIPVHMMSSLNMEKESLNRGALAFMGKPIAKEGLQEMLNKIEFIISRGTSKVLIIEDDSQHAKALAYFLGTFGIRCGLKSGVEEGLAALQKDETECLILDGGIPDQRNSKLLEQAKKRAELKNIPIIIFTAKSLSGKEEDKLRRYADSIVVKTAHSYKRLLDEVSLFLHLVEQNSKDATVASDKMLMGMEQVLQGKMVLVVDDDVRNIFSVSKTLEQYKMKVLTAVDGREALQMLSDNPLVDVILLDMMMPEMDGYETVKRIRKEKAWVKLPVIAITAKAMSGDREKCIEAGASDYITKPVDTDQLVSLLRVWLYEAG